MKIELQANESIINNWTLIYLTKNGGKYNGKLTVTNQRLLYDAKYDVSAKGLLSEAMFVKWGSEGYLTIPKSEIKSVNTEKSFFAKKVIISMADGTEHVFSYGMMNIDPVAEAIQQK